MVRCGLEEFLDSDGYAEDRPSFVVCYRSQRSRRGNPRERVLEAEGVGENSCLLIGEVRAILLNIVTLNFPKETRSYANS